MKKLRSFCVVGAATLLMVACSNTPALYCDETQACTAGHPICDLEGVCAASDFITNTCIPTACWDAGLPSGVDASALDAAFDAAAGPADAMPPPDGDIRQWQPPELLADLNTAAPESSPSISTDGLDLYFTRTSATTYTDILVASRASTANNFGSPVPVTAVNSAGQEWAPHISADNLELYFFRISVGLMVSKRASPGSAWGTPVPIGVGGQWADNPTTTGDGLTMYFVDQNTAGFPLFRVVRATKSSAWGAPVEVTYPGVARYRHVDISRDGLGLLLSSAGLVQNTDVVVSWKQNLNDPWTTLEVIPSLLDETLSPKSAAFNATVDEIYLSQYVSAGNTGDTELWVTRKE